MNPWVINPYDLSEEFRVCTYPNVMPGMFAISNYGRIWNIPKQKFTALTSNSYGYFVTKLKRVDGSRKSILVHRLVAWEFVSYRREINLQINHKDGNKLNNTYWNLEWVTPKENTHHAFENGLINDRTGIHNGQHKLSEEDVHFICRIAEDPNISSYQIAEMLEYRISPRGIRCILNGNTWKHISCMYNIPFRNDFYHSQLKGEGNPRSKLTEGEVRFIREQYKLGVMPGKILKMLNKEVSIYTVQGICYNNTKWKHLL